MILTNEILTVFSLRVEQEKGSSGAKLSGKNQRNGIEAQVATACNLS